MIFYIHQSSLHQIVCDYTIDAKIAIKNHSFMYYLLLYNMYMFLYISHILFNSELMNITLKPGSTKWPLVKSALYEKALPTTIPSEAIG
jgi:hypothetical protein